MIILWGWGVQVTNAQCDTLPETVRQLRLQIARPVVRQIAEAEQLRKQWVFCGQPTDTTFVRLLFHIGELHLQRDQYANAIVSYKQAVTFASGQPALAPLLAQAHYLLGSTYLHNNQADQARTSLLAVSKQAEAHPEQRRWGASAIVSLAYLYSSEGDYEQALRHIEVGRSWVMALYNDELMAQMLHEEAYALFRLSEYEKAVAAARQTIQLAARADASDRARYHILLGDIEKKRYETRLAIKAYRTAITFAQQANDMSMQAVALTNLGLLHYTNQAYDQSLHCAQQALAVQKNAFSRAILFDLTASCYWKMGQFERALAGYQEGLRAMPFGFKPASAATNPSADVMQLVPRKSVLLTLIQDKADTWLDYAKATKNNRQRLQHALETYQVADRMIDYMRWEHTGQLSKLYWRDKTRSMYERAIETCYRLGDTEQVFRFMEKSRGVMLADKLAELGARQQLTPKQMAEEQRLRQATDEQQTKLAGLSPGKVSDSLRTVLTAQQDKLDAFRKKLEVSNPAYYRYKYDTTNIQLRDLQAYLRPRKAQFVSYFVGDSALYVLGISGGRDTMIRQPVRTYNQTVRAFVPLLTTPDAMSRKADVTRFHALGKQLYDQLLAPLALPDGPVIVSSDGSFIPFETLSRSATQPDYLVKSYAFSYVYSANLLLKKERTPTQTAGFVTGDFLGIAPVSFAPVLGQATLSGSDDALKLIADRFDSPTLLTHGAATRRAFQSDVPAYRVIHLFTHATADSTGQEPTLYFADSVLRLSDLGDGGLPAAQLVVLAACKTGIGAHQRGEGVFSLARGFAALGVPSILTTLWSVENKATYTITNLFYRHLDAGLPKDVALQRAKQDWLNTTEGANQLPNAWAGLILVGDTQPLSRSIKWPWAVGGLVVLLGSGGGAWWWRRRYQSKPAVISSLRPV